MSAFPNIQEYYKNFEKQEDQINWKHEFIHLCIYIHYSSMSNNH